MNKKVNFPEKTSDILIVDDSPTQLARIKYFLERNNFKTVDCLNGNQALDWLSDHKPSLIISDVLMPGMNGFELCEKIKSDNRSKEIPVILLTALTDTEEVIKGLIAGADCFLTKPYDDNHLLSSIQKILEESSNGESYKEKSDLEIYYKGKKRIIRTEPQKVIKLLLNIYQGAIYQNDKLVDTREELRLLNEHLEKLVEERTSALAEEVKISTQIASQLRESEEKYRHIVETANEGIWKVDANLTTTFVNEKMAEMLGYSSAEMIGHNEFEFMDEAGIAQSKENLKRRRKGFAGSHEHKYIRKDGSSIITFSNVTPLKDYDGKFAGSLGLLTDITERKKVENRLKESREKLNLALEYGNIGIWEWDLDSNEIYWGESMGKMFGLKPGFHVKTSREFEDLVHDEDKSLVGMAILEALDSDIPYETIFRTKPKKGKLKYFSLKALVNKDSNGKPVRITGVCFDITKLHEDSEQISELNKKLLRSNKELERFAYVASHDLQEPLRMVSSFTQLLAQKYGDKLDDHAREYIQFAVEGAHRMYNLLNGLLTYSRLQRKGKIFTKVDVKKVLENVIKNLSLTICETGAAIKADKLPSVYADESQVHQLLQNLISNGIKFSTGPPKIYVSSKVERDKYVFSVKDEGIGIEPQYFERIFQIFQQLHPKNEYEGTGIGLSICKSIVERHKGRIWLESEPGKGSTFFFTLPRKKYS